MRASRTQSTGQSGLVGPSRHQAKPVQPREGRPRIRSHLSVLENHGNVQRKNSQSCQEADKLKEAYKNVRQQLFDQTKPETHQAMLENWQLFRQRATHCSQLCTKVHRRALHKRLAACKAQVLRWPISPSNSWHLGKVCKKMQTRRKQLWMW